MLLLMSSFYLFTGYMHFVKPEYLLDMMPSFLPYKMELIYLSGLAEIFGGLGVLIPYTRKLAAWGLILLLFAVLPANFHIAIHDVPVFGFTEPPGLYAWTRIPMQILLIKWARWYTE